MVVYLRESGTISTVEKVGEILKTTTAGGLPNKPPQAAGDK